MPKSAKRIRVYGLPRPEFDPDLMVQVLIVLGRELGKEAKRKVGRSAKRGSTDSSEPTAEAGS